MQRGGWLIGGAALALLTGGGWLIAAELAEDRARSLIKMLKQQLPQGSEVAYSRINASRWATPGSTASRFAWVMRMAWSADRQAGTAALDALGLELGGLAALQASGSLVIPEEDSLLNPDPAGVSLAGAWLVYTDRSLLQRLLTAWGRAIRTRSGDGRRRLCRHAG